jgi:hypothetical protein
MMSESSPDSPAKGRIRFPHAASCHTRSDSSSGLIGEFNLQFTVCNFQFAITQVSRVFVAILLGAAAGQRDEEVKKIMVKKISLPFS